jgi:hypothetical protein
MVVSTGEQGSTRKVLEGTVTCPGATTPGEASLTTDTRSAQLSSDDEKLQFLAKYLVFKSKVEAAEFHVWYKDNSGGVVSGPSEWDVKAILKVQPEDTVLWSAGMSPGEAVGGAGQPDSKETLGWGYELLPKSARWQVRSMPKVFTSSSAVVAVFQAEGIVMKRVVAH